MQCNDCRTLLPGYLDGELELMQSVEVEKHLETCEACLRMLENQRALQSAMRTGTLYHEPRPSLERSILSAIQKQERRASGQILFGAKRSLFAAAFAFAALLLLMVWATGRFRSGSTETDLLANEALAGHRHGGHRVSARRRPSGLSGQPTGHRPHLSKAEARDQPVRMACRRLRCRRNVRDPSWLQYDPLDKIRAHLLGRL